MDEQTLFSLMVDLHREGERQGPGGDDETLRALELSRVDRNAMLNVANIGCGTGAATLVLATKLPNARIQTELAHLGQIWTTRMMQNMWLDNLAPDIQEEILFLPRTTQGRDAIKEADIRPTCQNARLEQATANVAGTEKLAVC